MNNIDVTRGEHAAPRDGSSDDERVSLANSDQVAHQRIVDAVRWLMTHANVTQRQLADLLECDVSGVNRALLVHDHPRRRDWRAREVWRLALFFDVPVETFYGTDVERIWQERMQAARDEHRRLLKSLDPDN